MEMSMSRDALRLLPEIWLLLGSLVVLLAGSFLPRRRLGRTRIATLVALAGSGVSTGVQLSRQLTGEQLPGAPATVFDGSYALDTATAAARLIAVVAAALVVLLSTDELRTSAREAELHSLLLLATLGTIVLAGAHDLLIVVTGFLLASIPLYALIGLAFTGAAAEAAMKTYFYGSLFGIVLMLGVTILYGVSGATTLPAVAQGLTSAPSGAVILGAVSVLGGLMFKAGGVPGHFWVPDAAQGAGPLAAAFLTTVPKIGAVIAAYRLVLILPPAANAPLLVAVLAALSMTLGNLAAFAQDDPRRLLGWSTVSQVGYLLVPVAVAGRTNLALPSLLVYLAGYAVTNVAAFAVIAALPQRRTLVQYTGLSRSHPWLAAGLTVSLLGLVGTPPTAVFVGKLSVSSAAWDGGFAWLAVIVLANSALSLFYYLRWLTPVFARVPHDEDAAASVGVTSGWGSGTAVAAGAGSVALGLLSAGLFALFNAPLG